MGEAVLDTCDRFTIACMTDSLATALPRRCSLSEDFHDQLLAAWGVVSAWKSLSKAWQNGDLAAVIHAEDMCNDAALFASSSGAHTLFAASKALQELSSDPTLRDHRQSLARSYVQRHFHETWRPGGTAQAADVATRFDDVQQLMQEQQMRAVLAVAAERG